MNVTVVYGTQRHGSTWHTAQLLLSALAAREPLELTEFTLPRDMPHFCAGCSSCFARGENACPHAASVQPIAAALEAADVVVLCSPTYVYDVCGSLKALLDHLAYRWMPHRPSPGLARAVGVGLCTTAGGGARRTLGTIRKSLTFWCCRRVFTFGKPVAAVDWEGVSPKNRTFIERRMRALAEKILRARWKGPRLSTRFLFGIMKKVQQRFSWNPTDHAYWESLGYFSGRNPWTSEPEPNRS